MKSIFAMLAFCLFTNTLFGDDKDRLLEIVKSSYKSSELVYMMKDSKITVYKNSRGYEVSKLARNDIDLVVFYGNSLIKTKKNKSEIKILSGLKLRIFGDQVISSSLTGRISKVSLLDVETLLKNLAKASGFKPIVK